MSGPGPLGRLGRTFIDLIFPEGGCAICGGSLPEDWLPAIGESSPAVATMVDGPPEICPACLEDIFAAGSSGSRPPERASCPGPALSCPTAALLDGVVTVGAYGGALEKAVLRLKRTPDRRLLRSLARLIAEGLDERIGVAALGWSALIPVPLHPSRLRERGFNQAVLLAREISLLLDVPVWERACERVRSTPLQSSLSRADRISSLAGAFRLSSPGPSSAPSAWRRLLIIDDVLTTGATTAEVARVLKGGGAREVWCAAVARAT